METQYATRIKTIQSNNGPEFSLKEFYMSKGILHQIAYVETPQQNAIVERKHQHIMNVAQSLLFQANLPNHF